MKKIFLFLFAVTIFISFTSAADSQESGETVIQRGDVLDTVSPDREEPEEYIVQKGDTLWGISNKKLDDTFLWPRLWNVNPQIGNPDLIYPGLKIIIPSKEDLMRIPYAPKPKPKPRVIRKPAPVKAPPKYILSRKQFISSGWIEKRPHTVGKIVFSPMERRIVGTGDTVYLDIEDRKRHTESDASAQLLVENNSERYFSVRKVKKVFHPDTGKYMGHHVKITGVLEVIGSDDETPKAEVIESFEDVQIGDGLIHYKDMLPPAVPEKIRTPDIDGYVVESHINSTLAGEGDIIYLDRGEKDGLKTGDVFAAVLDSEIKRTIGTLQIISMQPHTSTAYILECKREILVGSKWGQKK